MAIQRRRTCGFDDCATLEVIELSLEFRDFDAFFFELARRLGQTTAAPSRVSVAIKPMARDGVAGVHYIWRSSEPDTHRVENHRGENLLQYTPQNNTLASVFALGESLRFRLWQNEGLSRFAMLHTFQQEGATDYLALPLPNRSAHGRAFTVCTDKAGGWTSAEVEQLRVVSRVVAVVLDAHESTRLQHLALTDGLTRLQNRHSFDHVLETSWAICARSEQPLTLLFVDVDHFKAYNDHYGHVSGDQCLKLVAGVLQEAASRRSDAVARLGGEEFVVLLPGCDADAGAEIAEQIRVDLAAREVVHANRPDGDHVTCSIGVATCVPSSHRNPSDLVHAADEAMYTSKASGRDRVTVSLLV